MMTLVPTEASTVYRLAEKHLGRPPGEWINERRAAGLTLRQVAAELDHITGVDEFVSYEAIRNWHTQWREFVDRLDAEVTAEKAS